MQKINCPICSQPSSEVKSILFSIKSRLQKILNDYSPQQSVKKYKKSRFDQSFLNLIHTVFGKQIFSTNTQRECKHQKISRYIKRKLKCDLQTLNQLCDRLISQIGQRNYQLQVLAQQFKTLPFTTLSVFLENNTIQKQKSDQLDQKPIKHHREKIEQNTAEKQQNLNKIENINKKVQQQNSTINFKYPLFPLMPFFLNNYPFHFNQNQ